MTNGKVTRAGDRSWSVADHFAAIWSAPKPGGAQSRLASDVVGYWPGGAVVRGVDAYNDQLRKVIALMPDVRLEVLEYAENEDLVFIRWASSGTSASEAFRIEGVDRLKIDGEKIIENRVFFDTALFAAATGSAVPGSRVS